MKKTALHKQLERLANQRWSRRGVRTLLQMTALGLSLFSIGLGGHMIFGWSLDYTLLTVVLLTCIALGAIFLLRPGMNAHDVARRLDKRFGLQEQITTALELNDQNDQEGVAAYLLHKARHNTAQVQRYTHIRHRFPWAELGMLLALVIVVAGLLLMRDSGSAELADTRPLPLPPLVHPDAPLDEFPVEPFTPPPGSSGTGTTTQPAGAVQPMSGGDQQSLSTIADALRDVSVTRPAAEALDRGNTSEAAQSLREVADQAGDISQEARRDLADALRDAANQIAPNDPDLATSLRDSAHDLDMPNNQSAADAFDELASAIEQTGNQDNQVAQQAEINPDQPADQPQSWQDQQQGTSDAGNDTPPRDQRERARPHERLGIEGVPLELEGGDDSGSSTNDDESQQAADAANVGGKRFEQNTNNPNNTDTQVGEDPLRIPADLRDVVQEYFSPERQTTPDS